MRLLTVVGNRPQFIKSAPLSAALREEGIEEIVVHTGQHWDPTLSAVFFEELLLEEPGVVLDLRTSNVSTIEQALRAFLTDDAVAGLRAMAGSVEIVDVSGEMRTLKGRAPIAKTWSGQP